MGKSKKEFYLYSELFTHFNDNTHANMLISPAFKACRVTCMSQAPRTRTTLLQPEARAICQRATARVTRHTLPSARSPEPSARSSEPGAWNLEPESLIGREPLETTRPTGWLPLFSSKRCAFPHLLFLFSV